MNDLPAINWPCDEFTGDKFAAMDLSDRTLDSNHSNDYFDYFIYLGFANGENFFAF